MVTGPRRAASPPKLPQRARVARETAAAFVTPAQVDAAWQLVRERLHRTPVVGVGLLGAFVPPGSEVFAKLETRQIMGSFKTRGALARLARDDARQGVVTASAGNHGLGVGFAGRLLGVPTTIIVPPGVAQNKRVRLDELASRLIVAPNPGYDEAERYARALARSHAAPFISPFDDPWVAAGNGATIAREIVEDLPGCDAIICPVGGGGLIAGIARYLEIMGLDIDVIGVQSEHTDAMALSLERGHAVLSQPPRPTLADGLEGGVAPRTFNVARRAVRTVVTVPEDSIGRAMALIFQEMGEVLEGSGAVTVAAVLEGRLPAQYRRPCLVFTGRNVDRDVLDAQLARHLGPRRPIGGSTR